MASENGSKTSAVDESCDASATARQRKKRKWDQPAESLVSAGVVVPGILSLSYTGPFVGVSQSGITTLLNPLGTSVTHASQPKLQDEVIAREIVINDAEASLRYKLTKRQTQEEIQKCTGAIVITRGKYRPPNAVADSEKPLYLHISSGAHLKDMAEKIIAVDRAAAIVEEMLKQTNVLQAVSTSHASRSVCHALNACVYLGFDTDPSTNIASRIRGPNDQYINHIMNETGATVLLRGRGSGSAVVAHNEEQQPLHLFISSNNLKSLDDARLLAENLLDTISMEFGANRISSLKVYNAVPPPQQLLPAIQSSTSALELNIRVDSHKGIPVVGSLPSPPPSFISVPGIAAVGLSQVVSQPGFVQQVQHSLASETSYSGYSGIYPQATPLQQVPLALKQSSPSVTSTVVSSDSQYLNTDARSTAQVERKPPRRRKFQELPVATEVSTEEHKVFSLTLFPVNTSQADSGRLCWDIGPYLSQGFRKCCWTLLHHCDMGVSRELSADVNAKHITLMPAPKKLVQPSSKAMPPPPPRRMHVPPPSLSSASSKSTSKLHEKRSVASQPNSVPDTLVKLMEYGYGDDDIDNNDEN
ncbi:unnamed protein product [Rhodiola kirilowii]